MKLRHLIVATIGLSCLASEGRRLIASDNGPKRIRYWFDTSTQIQTEDYQSEIRSIDASMLSTGIHTLHLLVEDGQGLLSPVQSMFFLKPYKDENGEPVSIRYWFDDQKSAQQISYGIGIHTLDISGLDYGMHSVNVQVVDSNGHYTPASTRFFYKAEEGDPIGQPVRIHYWLAGQEEEIHTVPYQTQLIQKHNFEDLPDGDYVLCYQVETDTGFLSPVAGIPFLRASFDLYVKNRMHMTSASVDSLLAQNDYPSLKLYYNMYDVEELGQLEVDNDVSLHLGKYRQEFHSGYDEEINQYDGIYYGHQPTLINQGVLLADSVQVAMSAYRDRWHFFALPFNVNLSDLNAPSNIYWALRRYDGAARAAGNMKQTWVDVARQPQLQAGQGYILQFTKMNSLYDDSDYVAEFLFRASNDDQKNALFAFGDVSLPLHEYKSEFAHNSNWNLIGNPYPAFFDTRYLSLSSPLTVWTGWTYKAISPDDDDYVLAPFEAFFIQRPTGDEQITFGAEGRQDTPEVRQNLANAPYRQPRQTDRQVYNLSLEIGGLNDECRIVLNEEAQIAYEPAVDAAKFLSSVDAMPQLYTQHGDVQYAINERPLSDGLVSLCMCLPQSAEYTLSLNSSRNAQEPLYVYDQQTHQCHSLVQGAYTFTATEGISDSRFFLSFGEVTGIDQVAAQIVGRIEVFDMQGKRCYRGRKSLADLALTPGMYVVHSKGAQYKIIIK